MVTEKEYKNALNMLRALDMEDEAFHQYLEIACDYENARSAVCSNTALKFSSICQRSSDITKRAAATIIGIY